jgi:hypothetical protein
MPSERICFVSMIIDLLLSVLERIALFYLGDRPYSPDEETFLEIFNDFRDSWSYYNVRATYAKAGEKRPLSPRVSNAKRSRSSSNGGYARTSDNDEKAPSDDNDKAGATSSVVKREMCTVCNKEICPVCGKCHGGNIERPSPSSDCVEVEVLEESPVPVTISSSPGDDYASGNNDGPNDDSDSSGISAAALRRYRSAVEAENTGDADAGFKEGRAGGTEAGPKEGRSPPSSSSDNDGGK